GVPQDEVHLADRLAFIAVDQDARLAASCHMLEAVSAEVRDVDAAVTRESKPVRQRPFGKARCFIRGGGELDLTALRHETLRAIRTDMRDAAARIGSPKAAVALGENAFWALQIFTDKADLRLVDGEAVNRVLRHSC